MRKDLLWQRGEQRCVVAVAQQQKGSRVKFDALDGFAVLQFCGFVSSVLRSGGFARGSPRPRGRFADLGRPPATKNSGPAVLEVETSRLRSSGPAVLRSEADLEDTTEV